MNSIRLPQVPRSIPVGYPFCLHEEPRKHEHARNPNDPLPTRNSERRGEHFFSASEGWGVEPTFRVALDRLDRRLLRSKELLAYNPKYAKDYLRKIGLPSEEE